MVIWEILRYTNHSPAKLDRLRRGKKAKTGNQREGFYEVLECRI